MSLLALTHVKGPQKMAIIILNSAMLVRQLRKGKLGAKYMLLLACSLSCLAICAPES